MEAIRRLLEGVRRHLGGMTPVHKVLVGSIAIILLLVLVIVAQVAGRPSLVEVLPGASVEEVQRARQHLDSIGITTEIGESGRLMVPARDAARASSALARANMLPGDKALYFENLLTRQSWMNSRQINEQNFLIALQNELARMIMDLNGVESARVRLDIPPPGGLGASVRAPKASVTVRSTDGKALPQSVVDGVARLVEGSVSGLTLERVTVIDAATGASRMVTTEAAGAPSLALEHAGRVEAQARAKLQEMLSYIPGVMVTVTASVDVTRSTAQVQSFLPRGRGTETLPRRVSETTSSTSETGTSAVPGVQANQAADITRAGSTGSRTDSREESTEYESRFGTRTETIVDPRGQSTAVAVSINVPRGYVEGLLARGGDSQAPDEKAILERFEKEVKPEIIALVSPHVRAMVSQAAQGADPQVVKAMVQESISVALVPGEAMPGEGVQRAGMLSSLGGGGGGPFGLGAGLVDKAVLILLSLVAMGLMVMMVRRAGRKPEMPTPEELVGVPPTLETVGDVIGEADEGETALSGIEVGEKEMEAAKRLEQVTEMVSKDPGAAAKLLGRWIRVEEG
jgi:flagellar M-ring protein FliF